MALELGRGLVGWLMSLQLAGRGTSAPSSHGPIVVGPSELALERGSPTEMEDERPLSPRPLLRGSPHPVQGPRLQEKVLRVTGSMAVAPVAVVSVSLGPPRRRERRTVGSLDVARLSEGVANVVVGSR